MVTRSSHSTSMWPPHSPTRTTKNSILKLAGAFHWPKTSRIRFWAFSYSMGEPCGRSNQLMMYFIATLSVRDLPTQPLSSQPRTVVHRDSVCPSGGATAPEQEIQDGTKQWQDQNDDHPKDLHPGVPAARDDQVDDINVQDQ